MGSSQPGDLTPREAAIMAVLWRLGSATAEQVRQALPEPLHDSTVRTFLRILVRKGHARREDADDGIRYRAAAPRRQAQRKAVRAVIEHFFAGSAEDLVLRMLEDEQITPEQLAQLRERRRKREK